MTKRIRVASPAERDLDKIWYRVATTLAKLLVLLLMVLPVPALVAPYLSIDPISWAYSVYHPFMYRYPTVFGAQLNLDLQRRAKFAQSFEVAKVMVEYW